MRWIYTQVHGALGVRMLIELHPPTVITTDQIWSHDWYLEAEPMKLRQKEAQTDTLLYNSPTILGQPPIHRLCALTAFGAAGG